MRLASRGASEVTLLQLFCSPEHYRFSLLNASITPTKAECFAIDQMFEHSV